MSVDRMAIGDRKPDSPIYTKVSVTCTNCWIEFSRHPFASLCGENGHLCSMVVMIIVSTAAIGTKNLEEDSIKKITQKSTILSFVHELLDSLASLGPTKNFEGRLASLQFEPSRYSDLPSRSEARRYSYLNFPMTLSDAAQRIVATNRKNKFKIKMAASSEQLATALLPEELEQLSPPIKEKIEVYLKALNNKLDESRIQYERLRVNSEQQTFELEKQISECEIRLESEANKVIEVQTKMNEYELQCTQLTSELRQIQETHNNVLNEQMHSNRLIEQLETDKRESAVILEKRAREMDKYQDELTELREKFENSLKERCEAITKSEDLASKELTLEYREQRLNQERELLSKQIDWLNKELTDKTQEVNSVRRDKTAKTIQLQNQLDQVTDELSSLREVSATVKESLEKQIHENETTVQKLKDARDSSVSMEESYQQQLRAQTRLADLYKSSSEDGQKRIEELVTAVEELQNVLSRAQEDFQKHEVELLEKDTNIIKERDALQEKVESLEKELSNANKLLSCLRPKSLSAENIAALSPSAAIASNLLKSGMTLTQIYCEYTKIAEELRIEKHESERLNQYIDQILQEIEERAPQLKRQKEDYEKAVETNASLTRQLETALREFEGMRIETDEAKRKSGHFERENQRLMRQVADSGLQVRTLLKEVEELRSGTVSMDQEEEDVTSTSSADLITKKLVTFKSIEELQNQNEQLLIVIRDLSESQEENEQKMSTEKNAELEMALSNAIEELEELRTARGKQAEVLESIVRQKDMYRVLLDQNQTSPSSSTRLSPGTIQPGSLSPNLKTREALTQLQDEFKRYKLEKAENDKILTEQTEKAKDEASEMRLQTARLTAQLEHSNERYKILQSNIEGCKKENSALIDKSQRLSAQVLRHEQIAEVLRQDLMSIQEKCSRAEVINENLKAERDLLKSMEVRWLQEKEVLLREQKGQAVLKANLQAIQNNLERGESETKLRFTSRIEMLEKENNNLRKKLEGENEQYKVAVKGWEKEVTQVRERIDAEIEKHHKVRDELVEAYSKTNLLKQELSDVKNKLNVAENRLSQLNGGSATSGVQQVATRSKEAEVKDLNFDLLNMKSENKGLKDQLNQTKQHLEQYKTIANSVEQEMKNEIEASKLFKETMEKRLQENLELHSDLEKKIQDLEKEKQALLNENQTLLNENLSQSSDLRKELATAQLELQNALQKAEVAAQTEQTARQDCQQQLRLAQEAQDRYEHELILHAADVEALGAVKLQLEEAIAKLPIVEEVARRANHELETQNQSWEEQKHLISAGKKELEQRCEQLDKQNAHLHDQIELMSTQMLALQSRTTPETLNISLSDNASKSAEQLLEVIRFLRRDKEIANTKLESINAENLRFKSKIEFMEKELEELQKNAIDNMQNSAVTMRTAKQHSELLSKVETVNVLTDSNRLLREERDTAITSNKELEARLSSIEKEVAPLQEKNRELVVQRDTLTSDVQVLKNEVKRWEARTKQLVEHRTNPEDLKRANIEKENFQKQVTQLTEEAQRQRAEISRMNVTMTALQNDLATAKANLQRREKEFEKITEDVSVKDAQMVELNKTIQQVKKIGRKYKTQYDELKGQYDELKANEADANKEDTNADSARQELESKLQETEDRNKTLAEQTQKITEELNAAKKLEENLRSQALLKEDRSRKVLYSVRQKMTDLTNQRDNLSKEIEELKKQKTTAEQAADEGNLRLNTFRSQYEGRISRLERELKEANEEREKTQKGCEELMSKMSQHQKQFGQYQATKITPTASTGGTSSEPPPTANIKPLAPTATNTTQRQVSTSAPPSRTTPTASIRPMAIPLTRKVVVAPPAEVHEEPRSATLSPPPLPQATVAPTPATISVAATVTPSTSSEQITIAVTPVIATDDSLSEAETAILGMPSSSTSPTPTQSTSDVIADGVTATPVVAASTSVITAATVTVQSAGEQSGECRESCETETMTDPSTSELTPSSSSTTKRQRAESGEREKDTSSPQAKKGRIVLSPEVRKNEEETVEIASSSGVGIETSSYEAVTSTSTETAAEKGLVEDRVAEPVIDEIILVESDDDDDNDAFLQIDAGEDLEREDEEENDDNDDEEEEEEDEEEEEEEEDEMEGEYSQDAQLEGDEQMQDDKNDDERLEDDVMGEAPSDEDVVEIIEIDVLSSEDDEEEEQMEAQDEVPPAPQQVGSELIADSGRPTPLRNVPVRMERLPTTGRQLTSFAPIGQSSGHFDEGDDSIVPSTPTLFPPRRSDGFAEAVNSPHVPQGRFVFGASQEMVVPVSTQLGSQGGMDDTRMDLQLDESSGRSVPTTPLQVSPPAESEVPTHAISPSPVVPEAPSDVTHTKGAALPIQEISVESGGGGAGDNTNEPVVEEPEVQQSTEEIRPSAEEVSSIPSISETISEPSFSETNTEARATTSQVQTTSAAQRRPTPIVWDDPSNQPRPPAQAVRLPPGRRMRVPGSMRGVPGTMRAMPGLRGSPFRGRQMTGRPMNRRPMRRGGRQPF
uniref:Nucleoprotein TPR n=1 Tax=Strigamia maritima TaxID=126957 RepID=T1J0B3_STRMM